MHLHLVVRVKSAEGKPVIPTAVRFVDTAPPTRERGPAIDVGFTDKTGVLDRHFEYAWPDYFAPDGRPDAGTFDVVVGSRVFHAAVECLPLVGSEREMLLDVVWSNAIVIE